MDFRGASAETVAVLLDELKTKVSRSKNKAATAADSLFEVSRTLRDEASLRRVVADASLPAGAKTGLITEIFGDKVDDVTLALLTSAATSKWTRGGDLPDGIEHLGEVATVRSVGTAEAERLADELFALHQAVDGSPELRDALSDPVRSTGDKAGLLGTLLEGKALPATLKLATQSLAGTYRTVTAALSEYQRVAASVKGEGVATVRVAAPLSDADTQRLTGALSTQYGHQVHVNVVVDPDVLGGIKVEMGDDVIDGTVSSRLADAGRALAG